MIIGAAFASILTLGCNDLQKTTEPVPVQADTLGTLKVTVTTSGSELDNDGYFILARRPNFDLEGISGVAALPVNGSATLSALVPDTYSVSFAGLAANCDVDTPATQQTIVAGRVTLLDIHIECTDSLQLTYLLGDDVAANEPRQFWITDLSERKSASLTADSASHETPSWSPDGSRMAFGSNRGGRSGIWLLDAAGRVSALNTGLPEDFGPRWSPDGRRIVFFSPVDGMTQLFSINADGTDLRGITSGSPGDYDPDWSPDGTKIVFSSKRDGIPGVWVVNVDGTAPIRLTSNSRRETNPVWSPDGAKIAFTLVGPRNQYLIYTMKADGSALTGIGVSSPLTRPAWSPNGRKIAFTQAVCVTVDYCRGFIHFAGIDGTEYTTLRTAVFAGAVAWRQRR